MISDIHPKLPMRDKGVTREFYESKLEFTLFGKEDYDGYLMLQKDKIQLHFFEFKDLDPFLNYGQVYLRTDKINSLYQIYLDNKVRIRSADQLQMKPWGIKEFSLLDPDHNLLTFGEAIE